MEEFETKQILENFNKYGILYRNNVRKKIQKKIEEDLNNDRIVIDKELLEALLFEEVNVDNKTVAKLPAWSGSFLRKVDLSEIDFSNVSWSMLDEIKNQGLNGRCPRSSEGYSVYNIIDAIAQLQEKSLPRIDYSMTNAKIDLTTSFEARNLHKINLMNCDFRGIDFKGQDLSSLKEIYIWLSDISYTNLNIPKTIPLKAAVSNFSGIDLSGRHIDGVAYLDNGYIYNPSNQYKYTDKQACEKSEHNLSYSILKDTGIEIQFDVNSYRNLIVRSCDPKNLFDKEYYERAFNNAFNDNWTGCFINGKINLKNKLENISKKR